MHSALGHPSRCLLEKIFLLAASPPLIHSPWAKSGGEKSFFFFFFCFRAGSRSFCRFHLQRQLVQPLRSDSIGFPARFRLLRFSCNLAGSHRLVNLLARLWGVLLAQRGRASQRRTSNAKVGIDCRRMLRSVPRTTYRLWSLFVSAPHVCRAFHTFPRDENFQALQFPIPTWLPLSFTVASVRLSVSRFGFMVVLVSTSARPT